MIPKATVLAGLLLIAASASAPARQDGTIYDGDIKVVDMQELKYPSFVAGGQGLVVVRVTLDNQGHVADATALSGPLILIRPSIENVKKWRFEPNSEKAAIIVYEFRVEGYCTFGTWSSQMIFYPPNFAVITACAHPPNT